MMGIKRERVFSPLPREVSLEDLVPEDSFYRRLEAAFWTSPLSGTWCAPSTPGAVDLP